MIRVNLYLGVFLAVFAIIAAVFVVSLLRSEKGLKVRKARLLFFGISLISFVFALIDLMQFAFGFHGIRVSDDFPYLWLGDIPFVSFLASFSIGGFFGMIERFLNFMKRKICDSPFRWARMSRTVFGSLSCVITGRATKTR